MKPTIGRIVIYRSRTGRYSLPALISVTSDTLYAPAVEGGHIPGLTEGEDRVHLAVFTAGHQGHRLPDTDPSVQGNAASGTYQEHDVPFWQAPDGPWDYSEQPPGSWTWPPRV